LSRTVYLSLGSNLGDRERNLEQAIDLLAAAGLRITRRSHIYETEPQDVRDQPWFLNLVVEAETDLFPKQLLAKLQQIEHQLGRKRIKPKGPRTIDIDILLYGNAVIETDELVAPHPRLPERRFVLEPLAELAPDLRWPNDLLLGGKKFGGVLTEMHAEPDRIHFVIVGIGINVNHTAMPAELAGIATSLRMVTGRTHSRLQLLVRLLRHLDSYYNRFLAEGPAPIVARFSEVSSYARGKRVRIATAKETYVGTTDGLEPNGLLRVRRDSGRVETVISGDVGEAP